MNAGARDRRVTFQRATETTDAHGGQTLTWSDFCARWAEVKFGTGAERRQGAQERASVPATFRVLQDSSTRTVTARDRISFDGAIWDIISVVPFHREAMDITAIRSST